MAQMFFSGTDRRTRRSTAIRKHDVKWHALEWLGVLTPQVRPATLSEIEPRIDEMLASKLSYRHLPADVQAAYRATTLRGRRIWMASWSGYIAVLNMLSGLFDLGILSGPILNETLLFRLLISAGFAFSACLITFGKPRRFDEFIIILPPVITVLLAGIAGLQTHSNDLFHHFMTMAIVTASTGVALLPIELNATILCTGFSFAIMLVFTFLTPHVPVAEELQDAIFFGSVFGALVFARHSRNANQHRIFLLKKKMDISLFQQTRHNARLSSIAYTDPLTEIPNRRYFGEMMDAIEVKPELYLPLAICMMDIDAFKTLNDQNGHGEGDRCLRLVASTLRGYLRHHSDVVARYGGDEFVLILPHTDAENASAIIERMRLAVFDLDYPNPGMPLGRVSMSAGIAIARDVPQVRSLIEAADLALYEAKAAGRNRTVISADAV